MPNDYRHPAPPYMRSAKPGRPVARYRAGALRPNMSVVPLVHTDGKGERVLYEAERPSRTNALVTEAPTL